ncbi:MAG: 3'-5' exonuclease [Myxococcota bacterium]
MRVVGLVEEFSAEDEWVALPIAFLDTETTGTDARIDRIIEVGIVRGVQGEVAERRRWLINPGTPIPAASTEVHGIRDEDVAGAPSFADVLPEIVAALAGALPAAYNASFDKGFVLAELERTGVVLSEPPPAVRKEVTWLDPLVFAREFFRGKGESRALGAVAERLGVTLVNAHRATDDAEAALEVLYALARDGRMPGTYAALIQEQRRLMKLQLEAQRFWRK